MGFRFRKSIRILPGLRLNLSKSGASTSIGGHGATLNISERGTRATVGLPGTGISYSERVSGPVAGEDHSTSSTRGSSWIGWIVLALIVVGVFLAVR